MFGLIHNLFNKVFSEIFLDFFHSDLSGWNAAGSCCNQGPVFFTHVDLAR